MEGAPGRRRDFPIFCAMVSEIDTDGRGRVGDGGGTLEECVNRCSDGVKGGGGEGFCFCGGCCCCWVRGEREAREDKRRRKIKGDDVVREGGKNKKKEGKESAVVGR